MLTNQAVKMLGFSNEEKPLILAGPCVIESLENLFEIAEQLNSITGRLDLPFVFKASFDKANRTSLYSYRGPGLRKGLDMLAQVKDRYNVKLITDIHLPEQAKPMAEVVDILQIPAFLCRQTDLLTAAAKTGLPINVKKAQFLSAGDMRNVVNKVTESGNNNIMLCERGTCFGYNNLIVDMTSLLEMKALGCPVIFDATHSVQKPGGLGESSGGNRKYVRYLARSAAAVGIDGLFVEVHPDPDKALSDGPNMVPLDQVEQLLKEVLAVHSLACTFEGIGL